MLTTVNFLPSWRVIVICYLFEKTIIILFYSMIINERKFNLLTYVLNILQRCKANPFQANLVPLPGVQGDFIASILTPTA